MFIIPCTNNIDLRILQMGIISGIADQNNNMFFFISSEPVGTHVLFEELGKVVLVTIVLLAS